MAQRKLGTQIAAPKLQGDEGYRDEDLSEEEKQAASDLLSRIRRAKTLVKNFHEKTLKENRRYSWGTARPDDEDSENTVRTNLVHATLATLLPHVYAKNPEIAVTPSEAVDESEYEQVKQFGKTCEVMLERCFIQEGRLKERAKANVRSAMTTSVGWIKLGLQKSLDGDPIILRRVNDIQDNIQRIEHLLRTSKKEMDLPKMARERFELIQQHKAIMSGQEVKLFKGLVLDRVQTEDILILDETIREFDQYVKAKAIAHGVWMTCDEYEQSYQHKPPAGAVKFGQPQAPGESDDESKPIEFSAGDKKDDYVRVWEVWKHAENTIYTVVEGGIGFCRPPFRPESAPERWYPFHCLGFNLVEGRWRPLSDVELLKKLQDEYNQTRYLFAETRKDAIPVRFFRKSGNMTEEDVHKITHRKPREIIGIEGNPSVPLANDIMQLDEPKMDPQLFDVTIIRNDMDMLVGLSDASRANLIQAKTATEAEIMRQALMNRVAERQDSNEDFISEMATAALEIMLREFTPDEVRQIAGPSAVWPSAGDSAPGNLSADNIFHKVQIQVRAGSTGKPNIMKEREQWTQLMPVVNDTMTQVAELRQSGNFDMADAKIQLLKESLRRYDERIDVDAFVPRMKKSDQEAQRMQQQMQAQQAIEESQKLKEELAQCQQEIQKLQQDCAMAKQNDTSKTAQIEADKAIAVAQEQARQSESEAKKAAELAKAAEAQAKAQAEADLKFEIAEKERETQLEIERMRIASEERKEELHVNSQERVAKITSDSRKETATETAKITSEARAKAEPDKDMTAKVIEAVKKNRIITADAVRDAKGQMVAINAKRADGTEQQIPIKLGRSKPAPAPLH